MRSGGTLVSIFSLIAITLGSGTLSFPYGVMMNGYILGPIIIVLGALLSYYTGMLIVKSSERTGRTRYEDIAFAIYGKRMAIVVSYLNLLCLIGFTFSNIVYIKKAVPELLESYFDDIPYWLGNNHDGQKVWGFLFAFVVMLPMSITRFVNKLRYFSFLGVLCSMYLCMAVVCVFFFDKNLVPDESENLQQIEPFKFSYTGIMTTFPLIVFAYMYQTNIPMIYRELELRNSKVMSKVVSTGSLLAVVFYILIGVFGYATFLAPPQSTQLCSKNILQANFKGNIAIAVSEFALLISQMAAAPLVLLPQKDTVEELYFKTAGMSKCQNLVVTIILVAINLAIAIFIETIGDAMTLVGSTINPIVGYILPIVFYWPFLRDRPWYDKEVIICILIVMVISIVSVMSLVEFFSPADNQACIL